MSDTQPNRLGKYEILAEIGKGGFATVYRAHDLDLGREVALKVLDPLLTRDPVWVARFRQRGAGRGQPGSPAYRHRSRDRPGRRDRSSSP